MFHGVLALSFTASIYTTESQFQKVRRYSYIYIYRTKEKRGNFFTDNVERTELFPRSTRQMVPPWVCVCNVKSGICHEGDI